MFPLELLSVNLFPVWWLPAISGFSVERYTPPLFASLITWCSECLCILCLFIRTSAIEFMAYSNSVWLYVTWLYLQTKTLLPNSDTFTGTRDWFLNISFGRTQTDNIYRRQNSPIIKSNALPLSKPQYVNTVILMIWDTFITPSSFLLTLSTTLTLVPNNH